MPTPDGTADRAAEVQRLRAEAEAGMEDYVTHQPWSKRWEGKAGAVAAINALCALATAPAPVASALAEQDEPDDAEIERLADVARHEYYERREDGFGRTFTWIAVVRAVLAAHGGQR